MSDTWLSPDEVEELTARRRWAHALRNRLPRPTELRCDDFADPRWKQVRIFGVHEVSGDLPLIPFRLALRRALLATAKYGDPPGRERDGVPVAACA